MCVQEVCGRLTKGPSVQLSCPAVPQWLCSPLRQERRGCPQGRQDSGGDDEAAKLPPQPRQTEGHLGIFRGPSLVCLARGSSGHAERFCLQESGGDCPPKGCSCSRRRDPPIQTRGVLKPKTTHPSSNPSKPPAEPS